MSRLRLRGRESCASLSPQREHEQGTEREVDEVHPLDQSDDDEHDALQLTARLRLPGYAIDGCIADETVADGGPDGASSKRQSEGDHCSSQVVHNSLLSVNALVRSPRGRDRSTRALAT